MSQQNWKWIFALAALCTLVIPRPSEAQKQGAPVLTLHHAASVSSIAFSPNGALLAAAYSGENTPGGLSVWRIASGTLLSKMTSPLEFTQIAFLGGESKILGLMANQSETSLQIWNVNNRKPLLTARNPKHLRFNCFAVARDGAHAIVGVGDFEKNQDAQILWWDINARRLQTFAVLDYAAAVSSVCFSPDGRTIAGSGGDWDSGESQIKILSVDKRGPKHNVEGASEGAVTQVALSPKDGTLAVVGDFIGLRDRNSRLNYRLPVKDQSHYQLSDKDQSHVIAFSPDGEFLAVDDLDTHNHAVVKIWRVATRRLVRVIQAQGPAINDLAFSPNGAMLATASENGDVQLWRAPKIK